MFFFRKLALWVEASKEARNAYGKKLSDWDALCAEKRKKGELIDTLAFPVSGYMKLIVVRHQSEHSRAIERLRKRAKHEHDKIQSAFDQYKKAYINYKTVANEIQEHIDVIYADIADKIVMYNSKCKYLIQVRSTGVVTKEMGAKNLLDLHEQIEVCEQELSALNEKFEKERSDGCSKLAPEKKQLEEKAIPVDQKIEQYRCRLKSFSDAAKRIQAKYDEELTYYLYTIGLKKRITVREISLHIIYELCEVDLEDINKSFSDELAFIEEVKQYISPRQEAN